MKSRFVFFFVSISSLACSAAIGAPERPTSANTAVAVSSDHGVGSRKLPLDHGPHAVTTPWVNQQRQANLAANKQGRPSDPTGMAKSQ